MADKTPTTPPAADKPVEIQPLSKEVEEAVVRRAEKHLGSVMAGVIERNFKDRGDLMDEQSDRMARVLSAQTALEKATGGYPVLGAFFQACAKAGHKTKDLSGQAEFIETELKKSTAPSIAKSINLADASEGGLLVEGTVLELWLEPLRASSVVLSLNPEIIPVTGDSFKVTGFETDPSIVWVEEENTAALTTTPTTGERETKMRKAMMLLPITADYRESASPAVLRRLEDLSRAAFRTGFDLRYITGTGLSNSIKGLRNLITATSASAGTTVANVLTDARTAWNAIESNNIPIERFGIIFAPRTKNHLFFLYDSSNGQMPFMEEMSRGTFLGWRFGATTNVPTNLGGGSNESYIIWQAMNQFFVGQSTALDLQFFQNASYTEGGSLVSSIERDTEVLRGRQKTATLMPHPTSGYVTTGVTYGA